MTQNCNDACASRCVLYREPGATGWLETTCIAEHGDGISGEPCTRLGGSVGDDTCAKGFFCSAIGTEPVCAPYCTVTADCGNTSPPTECIRLTDAADKPGGFCAERCFPFDTTCANGDQCVKFFASDGFATLACSDQYGTKQKGDACSGGDCAPMLSCESTSNGWVCVDFCESLHPCAGNETCTVIVPGWYQVCLP